MEKCNQPIAENARRLYAELRHAGRSTIPELESRTGLPTAELLLALGWLAREERIGRHDTEIYPLDSEFYF